MEDADGDGVGLLEFVGEGLEDAAVPAVTVDDEQPTGGVARTCWPTRASSRLLSVAVFRETVPADQPYSSDRPYGRAGSAHRS